MLKRLRWRTESNFVLFLFVVATLLAIVFLNTIGARAAGGFVTRGLIFVGLLYCASRGVKHHKRR